jgi:membrane protein implicated in regulation of membrane protease activity
MPEQPSYELIWFFFGLVLMLMELVLPGFIIIFFGIGAWCIAILLWIGIEISFSTQLAVFLVASIALLFVFRKYGSKYFKGKVKAADADSIDSVKGDRVVVISDIHPGMGGKVEFNGTIWNAESAELLTKGTIAEIVERNNLVLTVRSIAPSTGQ